MKKPNGLVLVDYEQLPEILEAFDLSDITGIGARVQIRLKSGGITNVKELCQAKRETFGYGALSKATAFGMP